VPIVLTLNLPECEAEIDYDLTVTPGDDLFSITNGSNNSKQVTIAQTSNESRAKVYTVTVTAKIGGNEAEKTFTVTIYDCGLNINKR